MDDITVYNAERKLVIVDGEHYICDILYKGKEAKCRAEHLESGERTGWIIVGANNAAFKLGSYIQKNQVN